MGDKRGNPSTKSASSSEKSSKGSSPKSRDKENKKTSQEYQRLSIIIFSGDPIDAPEYRHTGLFIEHLNQNGTQTRKNFLHVIGFAGSFERNESIDRNPRGSDLFAGSVHVATIAATGSSDSRLRNAIWTTAINNAEHDWNCQNWVGDALKSCVRAGLISSDETDRAISGMADLILQVWGK